MKGGGMTRIEPERMRAYFKFWRRVQSRITRISLIAVSMKGWDDTDGTRADADILPISEKSPITDYTDFADCSQNERMGLYG